MESIKRNMNLMHRPPGQYKRLVVTCLLALAAILPWTACTKTYSSALDLSSAPAQSSQSLLDYLKNNYAFSIFYAGIKKAGLDQQLTDSGKFTVLVPDNDAFARAGITADSVTNMPADSLRQWLGFHIVRGAIGFDSIPQTVDNVYFSILGQKIFFSRPVPSTGSSAGSVLHINGTAVNNFDLKASNGFIQVLNTPLNAPLPGNLQDYINAHLDHYSLFKASLQHFNLWNTLLADTGSQLTVFAPVNAVFANIQIYYQQQYQIYSIDDSVINQWDTTVIPKDIFQVYMLPSRIFTSDFTDAPTNGGPGGQYASYILPDRQAYVNLSYFGQTISAQLLSAYQYKLRGGAGGTIKSPGNFVTLSGNNVLQPIDHVLLIP